MKLNSQTEFGLGLSVGIVVGIANYLFHTSPKAKDLEDHLHKTITQETGFSPSTTSILDSLTDLIALADSKLSLLQEQEVLKAKAITVSPVKLKKVKNSKLKAASQRVFKYKGKRLK